MNKNTKQKRAKKGKISTGDTSIISTNPARNMRMKILWNKGQGVMGNCSLTVHEPIDKNKPFKPYKKKHYKYDTVSSVTVGDTDSQGNNYEENRRESKTKRK